MAPATGCQLKRSWNKFERKVKVEFNVKILKLLHPNVVGCIARGVESRFCLESRA